MRAAAAAKQDEGIRTRSTHWVWTHHVKGDHAECINHPKEVGVWRNSKSTYQVLGGGCQLELCKDGESHWQGWVCFDKEITLQTLVNLGWCKSVSFRKMLGPTSASVAYCSKTHNEDGSIARTNPESEPIVFGQQDIRNPHIKAGVGARNDLEAVIDLCREGNTMEDIAQTCPNEWIKFNRGIRDFLGFCAPKWEDQTRQLHILWGESNVGKDWMAKRIIGNDSVFVPDQNNQSHYSFESYENQMWIYFPEYKGHGLFLDDLKKMSDRYKCILRGRGCSKVGLHIGIIICSQASPQFWYPNEKPEDMRALLRRVTGLWHCRRSHWMNQLTGELIENPCPWVKDLPPNRNWEDLPTVPEDAGVAIENNPVWVNSKKRKVGEVFPENDFIDLR